MNAPTSLRDRIAQLCFVRFGSNMLPKVEASDDFDRVRELVEQYQIGGLLLFNAGTAQRAAESLARIQAVSEVPLAVAADMERGIAQQVTDLTTWPHALAFDALADEAANAAEEFARLTATEANSLGVHISFSPVADIHRNSQNPIIANRAFGRTADRVSELAAAYVRGCHSGGLLCCGKHFPGHGNTFEDSHAELPVVRESLAELSVTDLAPFRALIETGVDMFMTAHVAYPALDRSGQPATLSRPILTELLREQFGFEGAVVSDSLKMDGVKQDGKTESQLAVEAVAAGVDLLLDVSDVGGVIDALEEAANANEQFADRVESAFEHTWAIKTKAIKSPVMASPDAETVDQHAMQVARKAVSVVNDDGQLSLPLTPDLSVSFLLVNPFGDNAYTNTNCIVEAFRSRPQVDCVHLLGPGADEEMAEHTLSMLATCDVCVIGLVLKPMAWQTSSIPAWQKSLLDRICAVRPTIVAALGIPELLADYPEAAIQLATNSDAPACQVALAERILGGSNS